jgi:AcrR family transcriptional regulator
MSATLSQDVRDSILDSAEEVVNQQGVGRLTLDVVARQAGLSKSGLLHHFPSKDALIDAILARTVQTWQASLQQAAESLPPGPYPTARALLQCCLGETTEWDDQLRRTSTAILSVLVHCPGRSTALHTFYQKLHAQMKEEAKGVPIGDLVLAVVDGIWLRWVTGLAPLEDAQVQHVRDTLRSLLDASVT